MPERLHSLRTRILAVFVGVILIIFVAISVVFNQLVQSYVSATATAQLSAVVARHPVSVSGEVTAIPDISETEPSPLDTRPAVFLLKTDYTASTPLTASAKDQQTAQDLALYLKTHAIDLSHVANLMVVLGPNSYYVSCVTDGTTGDHLVFYVDVTGIVTFANRVNLLLMVIMLGGVAIAGVATGLITRRLTRPLAELTAFSQRLGTGDFTPCPTEFHDRELATLADSMNHAARQLDSYDKDQKTFFQNASHELRTPLMSITCYAEGIAYGIMDPVPASQTILNETTRLGTMVEDLLSVSRLDAIAGPATTELTDLAELLRSAAAEQDLVAADRGVTFSFDCDPGPVLLPGDAKALRQGFSNLISNAVRYARASITLTARRAGQSITVEVADDGTGISDADLPHIFERFYTGTNGHHGIGLAIVKSVVEQHGGQITVESGTTGTRFTLHFPVARTPGVLQSIS